MCVQWILQTTLKWGVSGILLFSALPARALSLDVKLLTPQAVEGKAAVITATGELTAEERGALVAKFADREIPFFPLSQAGRFAVILPVPHGHPLGVTQVEIQSQGWSKKLDLEVVTGNYPAQTLTVAPKYVSPGKEDEKRIARESHLVGVLYNRLTPERLWSGPFTLPIASEVTSPFGNKRVYNGELKNVHLGTDLRAPSGTAVRATAAGEVVMAKNLYYTGNTVMLDHGYGVFTLYAHLSRLKVKTGQRVKAQQLLGLSGMTGRVTGPHLHWMAIVRKVKIDPIQLLEAIQLIAADTVAEPKGTS